MKRSLLRIIGAICISAIGIGILVLIARVDNPGKRDFIEYWAAGQQLVHGANPYDSNAILQLERSAGYIHAQALVTPSPPVAFFLVLPLGFFGANSSSIFWMLAIVASLLVSIRMIWGMHGRPDSRLHLLGYCFAPLMECVMAGQIGIFLLLSMVLFLYFHKTSPFIAGAVLLPCALKPHLFLPFAIALLLWMVGRKVYRILAGFTTALIASCALTLLFDGHVWSQYLQSIKATGILDLPVPTLSATLRFHLAPNAVWLQFLPEVVACGWALWYFWSRRDRWNWMDQGLLVLLVSVMCAPYAWFTDESVLLIAVLAGLYRAESSGRSLIPFGLVAGVAMMEVFVNIPIGTGYYLWTTPAWLAWYLYATWGKDVPAAEDRSDAVAMAN